MVKALSDNEIKKVRTIIAWYEHTCKKDDEQIELEKELTYFPTEGDGY